MYNCSLKALANEDTLLPTQMFPRLSARATFVADTNFVSGTVRDTKNVSDFVQKHFVPQQMFPSLRAQDNVTSNNVSATMFLRLPPPLHTVAIRPINEPISHETSQLIRNLNQKSSSARIFFWG